MIVFGRGTDMAVVSGDGGESAGETRARFDLLEFSVATSR